ncbi:MAG TPA: copper resistance protein B [Candidatus Tectomicrobia bacterium]
MTHLVRRTACLLVLTGWLIAQHAVSAVAQVPSTARFTLMPPPLWAAADMSTPMPGMGTTAQMPTGPHAGPHTAEGTPTLPNLADRSGWPSPVDDTATYSFLLFDLLEYQRNTDGLDALRWDILGWLGGDSNRFWFKSEGRKVFSSREGSEVEVQALYGRLIAPFFDLQVGLRYDQRLQRGANPTRVYAVLGLQGLAPYWFDIEPTLFISNKGQVSARLTATYDVLLSQQLILQPRLETNVAFQKDEAIGIAAGFNDVELGGRLRYEIRREFAPYIGVTWKESIGATHRLTVREGGDPSHLAFVAGVRLWF